MCLETVELTDRNCQKWVHREAHNSNILNLNVISDYLKCYLDCYNNVSTLGQWELITN